MKNHPVRAHLDALDEAYAALVKAELYTLTPPKDTMKPIHGLLEEVYDEFTLDGYRENAKKLNFRQQLDSWEGPIYWRYWLSYGIEAHVRYAKENRKDFDKTEWQLNGIDALRALNMMPFDWFKKPPETCPICLGSIYFPYKMFCGHVFCQPCIEEWLNVRDTCPLCREPDRYVIQDWYRCVCEMKEPDDNCPELCKYCLDLL